MGTEYFLNEKFCPGLQREGLARKDPMAFSFSFFALFQNTIYFINPYFLPNVYQLREKTLKSRNGNDRNH
jgi:hypothetical protein